jgi:hypothetical protein
MGAAVEKTATLTGGPLANNAAKSGPGYVEAVYTVTIATTLDWVILSEFDEVLYVHAFTEADGEDAEAYIDGTTKNKVFITGTGATTLLVKGTPAK